MNGEKDKIIIRTLRNLDFLALFEESWEVLHTFASTKTHIVMIIGREKELQQLHDAYNDEYSQFVVVYGRRRVGKTFLVLEAFNYKFTFLWNAIW